MLRLSRNGVGLLSSQYRSVLRKCALLNMCAASMMFFAATANATEMDPSEDFKVMGTEVVSGNSVHFVGNYAAELFDEGSFSDAWIRNYGEVYFGDLSATEKDDPTVVSNKHNTMVNGGDPRNGGGVISNMNHRSIPEQKGGLLTIWKTEFRNNSVSNFVDTGDGGAAAGGVLTNYSGRQVSIGRGAFNDNYAMSVYHAAGGAIYNGSSQLSNGTIVSGDIKIDTGSVFVKNHAGNEKIDSITPGVESNIFNLWSAYAQEHEYEYRTVLATGGAIHNEGTLTSSGTRFEYNHAIGITSQGGAIYNNTDKTLLGKDSGIIEFDGDNTFYGNYAGVGKDYDGAYMYSETAQGGAIYNAAFLNVEGATRGNSLSFGYRYVDEEGNVSDTPVDGYKNYVIGTKEASGGAIYNAKDAEIDAIIANSFFYDNHADGKGNGKAMGGAIYNAGKIAMQGGYYIGNYTTSEKGDAIGGAIYNAEDAKITLNISGNGLTTYFGSNSANQGGAIYNAGTIDGSITSVGAMVFEDNVAKNSSSGGMNLGNSIYNAASGVIKITLENKGKIEFLENQSVYNDGQFTIEGTNDIPTNVLGGNFGGDTTSVRLHTTLYSTERSSAYSISRTNIFLEANGYIDSKALNSSALNDTKLTLLNNNITLYDGSHMHLNSGNDILENNDFFVLEGADLSYIHDDTSRLNEYLGNNIDNSGSINYYGNATGDNVYVAKTLLNSNVLNVAADKILTNVHIDNLESYDGNKIVVNLQNDKSGKGTADIIVIKSTIHNDDGAVTNVVFNDMNNKYIGQVYLGEEDKIYFAQTSAEQTDYDFKNTFSTSAVNDNYEIAIGYELDRISNVYNWYLYRNNNLDPRTIPENFAMSDVPAAAVEQLRSITSNIPMGRTNRGMCNCYSDDCYNSFCKYEKGSAKTRFWATPVYTKGSFDTPVETDFTIKGIEFGIDYQPTTRDMFGVFGSYRSGEYDISGKGKDYSAELGSKLDMTSILGGIYYRRYFGNMWMFGAVYGGKVDVDLKAKNDVSASLKGNALGAEGQMGYDMRLSKRGYLTPSLRATYNYIKFKDVKEFNGKEASIDAVNNIELEAALKYEYHFNNEYQRPTTGYIKPSIIQNISQGGKVKITTVEYDDTLDNSTLGRIEVGADAELMRNFSVGAFGNYTFGSDYSAWGIGANVKYVW